jgi:hypothetical protein
MRAKKLIAAGATALALLVVGGTIIAAAGTPNATPKPATSQSSSVDTDTLQVGDQTSPDDANEPKEAEEEANEPKEANDAEEPGDESLPGGGHEDQGENVNHEFEGTE